MKMELLFSDFDLDQLALIAQTLKAAGLQIEVDEDDLEELDEPKQPAQVRRLHTVQTEQEEDGRHIAEVEEVPGAVAYGATEEEAAEKAVAIAEQNTPSVPVEVVVEDDDEIDDGPRTLEEIEAEVEALESKQDALEYLQKLRNGGSVEDVATRHTATIKKVILSEVRQEKSPVPDPDEAERNAIYAELATLSGSSVDEIDDALGEYSIQDLRAELQSTRESAGVEEPTPEDDVVDAVYTDMSETNEEEDIFASDNLEQIIVSAYTQLGDKQQVVDLLKANIGKVTQLGALRGRPDTVVDKFLTNTVNRYTAKAQA